MLEDSILLILSMSEENREEFGTGFILCKSQSDTYVLTCLHVIETVLKGRDNIINEQVRIVDTRSISNVTYKGEIIFENSLCDLAVIKIPEVLDQEGISCAKYDSIRGESRFTTRGYFKTEDDLFGSRNIKLDITSDDESVNGIKILNLAVSNAAHNYGLNSGYSGSPVYDKLMNRIVGIVQKGSIDLTAGKAIKVEILKEIWADIPASLETKLNTNPKEELASEIKKWKESIELNAPKKFPGFSEGFFEKSRRINEFKDIAEMTAHLKKLAEYEDYYLSWFKILASEFFLATRIEMQDSVLRKDYSFRESGVISTEQLKMKDEWQKYLEESNRINEWFRKRLDSMDIPVRKH